MYFRKCLSSNFASISYEYEKLEFFYEAIINNYKDNILTYIQYNHAFELY